MMPNETLMGSGTGKAKTTVPAKRRLESWIEAFVEQTSNLHVPEIFRRWSAIATIAATLEQKVWVTTSQPLHPNLYIFIIGHPGVGKTKTIREARLYVNELPEFHLAPISMTFASLVDSLVRAKRSMSIQVDKDNIKIDYNSMFICADELGAFIHKYDNEMIDGLSAFYDPNPYQQVRRTNDLKVQIKSPQLNILCGSTPQNLSDFMPEKAWGQGFTSRLIMVFSDERIIGDDFAPTIVKHSDNLAHDLCAINNLVGGFEVTSGYIEAVNNWRQLGEVPVPSHPKLLHYVTRRRVHLYKLSMISAIDRSNALILTRDDFNRALGWLLEAELTMPEIFKAGATNADGQAMEEIVHFISINDRGQGVSEQKITRFAADRIPVNSIIRALEILERSGQIHVFGVQRGTKIKFYKTGAREYAPSPQKMPADPIADPAKPASDNDPRANEPTNTGGLVE